MVLVQQEYKTDPFFDDNLVEFEAFEFLQSLFPDKGVYLVIFDKTEHREYYTQNIKYGLLKKFNNTISYFFDLVRGYLDG